MRTLLSTSRADITERILDFVVDQWASLDGAALPHGRLLAVVDPEVLIMLTSAVGRHDSRVFDAMVDWLVCNGQWINVQRLARLVREDGVADTAALGAVAAWLDGRVGTVKWRRLATTLKPSKATPVSPLFVHGAEHQRSRKHRDPVFAEFGLARSQLEVRGHAQPVSLQTPASLVFTSRGLFGVSVRADVMAYLAVNQTAHARALAAELGYNHMQVRAVLLAFEQAGVATSYTSGRTRQYAVDRQTWRQLLCAGTAEIAWVNSRSLAAGLQAIVTRLWSLDADRADDVIAESLIREAIHEARDALLASHPSATDPAQLPQLLGADLAAVLSPHLFRSERAGVRRL